jgi:phage baseplate assembly protein V
MLDQIVQKINYLKQQVSLMHRKMANIIARGNLTLINMSGANINNAQGTFLDSETISDLQHPQEFGFASMPKKGAYIIAIFNGGSRDHGQAIKVYDPSVNPTDLASGDSCQYDASGNRVWLKGENGILIKNQNNTITLNNSGINITDKNGNSIVMSASGITVTSVSNITFASPVIFQEGWTMSGGDATGTGSLSLEGNIADGVGSMATMRTQYNGHIHSDPQGGDTGTPDPSMS